MKIILSVLLFVIVFFNNLNAQLEGLIVETYYVADANDAMADPEAGEGLSEGSITYRIYVDMLPGSKLKSVFGTTAHPLVINSTAPFFNHEDRSATLGMEVRENELVEGTKALDSWLSLGSATRNRNDMTYFGVRKILDSDNSSIVAGIDDTGEEINDYGLLKNNTPEAGRPLTEADGLILTSPISMILNNLFPLGALQEDSSIFQSNSSTEYISTDLGPLVSLSNEEGITGPTDENEVLIAQLTTAGELSFTINLEIKFEVNGELDSIRYVSSENVQGDEVFSPLLSFPYTCGCTDPNFLEASTAFACEDQSLCLTPVVLGCMDTLACNYDPSVNLNVEELCCYPAYCNDRDLSLACPELPIRSEVADLETAIMVYPNPAREYLQIEVDLEENEGGLPFLLYNVYGQLIQEGTVYGDMHRLETININPGMYYLNFILDDQTTVTKTISIL